MWLSVGFIIKDLNPGRKCLSDSFDTYDEAKRNKAIIKKDREIECTAIFNAKDQAEAEETIKNESFSRL